MAAVSYPEKNVVDFVSANLIPIQVASDAEPLASDFLVSWTPLLILLDADGKEHCRSMGFLPPEELVPYLMLGIAKIHFDRDDLVKAIQVFDSLLVKYPRSIAAPEALFLCGVSLFKDRKDPGRLKETYEDLKERYPDSDWVVRSSPYRLL